QEVSLIGWAMEYLDAFGVCVQRTVGGGHKNVVCPIIAPGGSPIWMQRIEFIKIAGVHVEGKADLPLVAQTLGLLSFGFRLSKGRQQKRSQNCNDRDDDQQLNQGKAYSR